MSSKVVDFHYTHYLLTFFKPVPFNLLVKLHPSIVSINSQVTSWCGFLMGAILSFPVLLKYFKSKKNTFLHFSLKNAQFLQILKQ